MYNVLYSRGANFFQPSKTMFKTCFGSQFYSWEIIKKNLHRILLPKQSLYTVTKKLGLTGTLYTALTLRTCIRKESFTFFAVTIFEKLLYFFTSVRSINKDVHKKEDFLMVGGPEIGFQSAQSSHLPLLSATISPDWVQTGAALF